jgi:hypothetical protein
MIIKGFNTEFAVKQVTDTGTEVMTVAVSNVAVSAGNAGSLFANDGGQLTVSNLIMTDLDAASLISTSNSGTSFLQNSSITNSAFDSVTITSSAGAQTVIGVQVSQMRRLKDVYLVEGLQSSLSITGSSITQNSITEGIWSGVVVQQGARATVSELDFSSNSGVAFGVSVSAIDSSLTMMDSFITQNNGTVSSFDDCRVRA